MDSCFAALMGPCDTVAVDLIPLTPSDGRTDATEASGGRGGSVSADGPHEKAG